MVADEGGSPVPELVRRVCMEECDTDPVPEMAATLERMVAGGVAVGDVLADSGYAHRMAANWADRVRAVGGRLVQDPHPSDRGPKGTYEGAVVANGNLWCPATPAPLLDIAPLPRGATSPETEAHDARCAEAARYKLGRVTADDADGYHRVACPAAAAKLRCPLREGSMALGFDRPEILSPPERPPLCCSQVTITVPPHVGAKKRQKHDYPSRAFASPTCAAPPSNAASPPSRTRPPPTSAEAGAADGQGQDLVMLTMATVVRNLRVLAAFARHRADDARRAAAGQPPRTRKRRRVPPPQGA